ncbi:MAG: hypothetical protein A3H98_05670 [Bacteroidetes bacterium RIFCSPLOWO2_02_FULL_36_8]|nr:MAG: hypothetical protein A3H98_05670 [Bacteroidetes bacterium RIFCSPLOWO2_02_FULL_36_8]OFY68834.1 MAG: hypothetical protein A3G23_03330 [Bacteroidetes bacterium RIFCSPLOWO2_12_FULL_37_12]
MFRGNIIFILFLFSFQIAPAQQDPKCSAFEKVNLSFYNLESSKTRKFDNTDSLMAYRIYKRAKKCYYSQKFDSVLYYLATSKPLFKQLGYAYDYVWCSLMSVNICKSKADYPNAFNFLKEAEQSIKEFPGIEKNTLGAVYSYYGIIYSELGYFDEGMNYFLKDMDFAKKNETDDLSNLSGKYNNLGQIYKIRGDFDKALENYQTALEISIQNPDIPETEFHNTYHNLGNFYLDLGDLENAFIYLEKALSIRLKNLGESHSETANTLNDIGNLFEEKEDYLIAEQYYQKSLAIYMKIFGLDHPLVIGSVINLSTNFASRGEYQRCLDSLIIATERVRNNYSDFHPLLEGLYSNLGNTLVLIKKFSQAKIYFEKSLVISYSMYGRKSNEAALDLKNLGILYEQLSLHSDSIPVKNSMDSSLYYFQSALEALVQNFNSIDVYKNPPLVKINSQPELLNVLIWKADMLVSRCEYANGNLRSFK